MLYIVSVPVISPRPTIMKPGIELVTRDASALSKLQVLELFRTEISRSVTFNL